MTPVTKVLSGTHPNVVDVIMDGTRAVRDQHAGGPLHRLPPRRVPHSPRRRRKAHPVLHLASTPPAPPIEALATAADYDVATLAEYVGE